MKRTNSDIRHRNTLEKYSATAQSTIQRGRLRKMTKQACLGFGAAGAAVLVPASQLDAAIVYSGPKNIMLSTSGSGSVNAAINMDGGAPDFNFALFSSTVALAYGQTAGKVFAQQTSYVAKKFSSGNPIALGSALTYPGNQVNFTQFVGNVPAFLGVQLGSGGNFGWIQIQFDETVRKLTIIDWAYDDAGGKINAGQTTAIPEPSSAALFMGLGLLSLGSRGVRTLRRRKREAALKS